MGTHSQLASHGRRTCTPVAGRDDAVLFPASTSAFQGAGIGLFVSAIKNSLESHNKGAMGIFTRTGWIGGYLAAIGFTYTATRNTLLNTLSPASAAGCAAGFVAGVRTGSIPKAMGLCAFMGGALGTFDAAGARIGNTDTGVTGAATVATQEQIRKQFFKKRVTEPSE